MNENTLLSVIRGFVSFVLSLTITVCAIAFWAQTTILQYNKVENYIEDTFYDMLYDEVCENIIENTVSTGLPENVLTAPITRDIVKLEMDNSIKALYNGEKYSLKTASLKDDYKALISEYTEQNNLELDEESADALVNYVVRLVENSVRLPFANTLSPYFTLIKQYIVYVAYGLLAASLLIALFLFFLCRPRKVFLRYTGRSMMCFGVLGAFVAIYVTSKNLTGSVNIASAAYSEMILNISQKSFGSLLILSITFFVSGAVFSAIGQLGLKQASADNTAQSDNVNTENNADTNDTDNAMQTIEEIAENDKTNY